MNSVKIAAAALGLTVAFSAAALAAPAARAPLPPGKGIQAPDSLVGSPLTVKGIYETSGAPGSSIPAASYTAVDAQQTIKCAVATGCSIHTKSNLQMLAASDGGNWAIATVVDGSVYLNHATFYQGVINTGSSYKMGTDQENGTLAYGSHKVQTFVWLDNGGTLASFDIVYNIAAP